MKEIVLKVEQLSKKYIKKDGSEFWAIKDVSFELAKGESLGIIGLNGSGKSTLLKLIIGLIKPTSGKITYNGKMASILDIGAGFHPDLTGKENIFLKGELLNRSKAEIEEVYSKIVEFSEIETFIDEPVKNYSSGMFLRLAYSTLLFLDFDIYLFDEVVSVGDQFFRNKIKEKGVGFLNNKTTITVSHDLTEITNSAQTICLLEQGQIKFIGDKNNAIAKYLFERKESQILPIKEEVEMISIKVNGISYDAKKMQLVIKKEDKIALEIVLENLCDDELVIVCNIVTNSGIPIATDSHRFRPEKSNNINFKGLFSINCTIPPNLFNKGNFIIFFNSISSNVNFGDLSTPFFAIELEVIHNTWEENMFFNKYTTPLQPYLEWKVDAS